MRCTAVQQRLVAYQDQELSPGEQARVSEHLNRCIRCQAEEDALFSVTPRPELVVPQHVQEHLQEAVDADILWALALQRPPPTVGTQWARWWSRDAQFSRTAVFAYAAILLCAVSWGMTNWWTVSKLEAEIARQETIETIATPPGTDIPAQQYRPAAYTPDEEGGYR